MRKFLALVLALVMTMSLVTVSAGAATDFTDDAKITNVEAVEVLNAIGILGGYADGSFRPQATLTRGAGAKLVAYLMLGQEKADNLKATYTVFADVTDGVALAPYIEWAAANGIVGGYGDGNFGPYNTLTEYAFGKMLLTAIGYDAELQGYTGAGWQKAVYRDAIAKDIYTGTESYGACTRDTAAAMTLATLETEYVVYGTKEVNGWFQINGQWVPASNVVNRNGVYDTKLCVWETYEDLVFNGAANDKWGNQGDRWIYEEKEIGFYEDATVATYTEQVDYCDLLVDLGISENSAKTADLTFVYNGDVADKKLTAVGHGEVAVFDEFEYYVTETYTAVAHAPNHYTCDDKFVGGQGVLTKVFETGKNDYRVTEVATYLAVADAPVKAHNAAYTTNLNVAYRDLTNFGKIGAHDLVSDVAVDTTVDVSADTDVYAKGEYVLVTVEIEGGKKVLASHALATGTTAKLTSYVTAAQASPAVGTTNKTPDAFGFGYGYADVKNFGNLTAGKSYVFYHDAYGNVIGAVEPESVTTYAVLDAIYSGHAGGKTTLTANVVTLDAVNTKDVNVAEFNGTEADLWNTQIIVESAKANEAKYAFQLYTYSVTDGDYTLKDAAAAHLVNVTRTSQNDELSYYDVATGLTKDLELTATTQFLLRDTNGAYTAVTGYANLPVLTAAYAEVIYAKNGVDADIVYLHDVAFDGAKVVGYIVNAEPTGALVHTDKNTYYSYNLYVDGVAREVYMTPANMLNVTGAGLYEVQFNAVDGLLAVNNVVKVADDNGKKFDANEKIVAVNVDGLKITTNNFVNYRLDLAKVYLVDTTSYGTIVTVGEYTDLAKDQTVDLVWAEDAAGNVEIAAIYVTLKAGV